MKKQIRAAVMGFAAVIITGGVLLWATSPGMTIKRMLSKYYISDWYVRGETSVLVVLVWTNPHEQPNK